MLELQSAVLSRQLIDPDGETTVYRMVRQIFSEVYPCHLDGDLLLTTFWVGEPGQYTVRSELVGNGEAAESADSVLATASQEIELAGETYVLMFNYGRPAWPAPGLYRWNIYLGEQPEPLGCYRLPVSRPESAA